jgi:hypothetical protein
MFDNDDEFLKFDRISPERRLSARPDLCAFLLLEHLVPGTRNIIGGAEHDEIYLSADLEALLAAATEDDIVTLVRCGVRADEDNDALCMFA